MTLAVAGEARGRPASTVTGLTRSLERARLVNVELRSKLRVERIESATFAEHVRQIAAGPLARGVLLDRSDLIESARVELGYRAARRLAQLGSVVL